MDPVTFARHFARLVWLLIHERASVDEQKSLLRALVLASKDGPMTLAVAHGDLTANDASVAGSFSGVRDVVDRFDAFGTAALDIATNATPAEVLGVARLLACETLPAGPLEAARKRDALTGDRVHLVPRLSAAPLPDGDEAAASDRSGHPHFVPLLRLDGAPVETLLAELVSTTNVDRLELVLDALPAATDAALHDGKDRLASDILHGVVMRDASADDASEKRLLATAMRRLASPAMLTAVAMQLPREPDRRGQLLAVLVRAGADGATAIVEQIATAVQPSDRRCYLDVLLHLPAAIPTLVQQLGDPRWFVARSAADLLGEMHAQSAEAPLAALQQHDDDRVRRSATGASMRLGTPRALQTIRATLRGSVPQLRIQAALALAERTDVHDVAPLLRALDVESDTAVKAAILLALGRMGGRDAVQRLIAVCQPERGFFRRRTTTLRVAAVQALGEARSAEALQALNALLSDRRAEVRDAATFAMAKIASRGTTG